MITNLNPSSAADPINSLNAPQENPKTQGSDDPSGFQADLEKRLAQKGVTAQGAEAAIAAILSAQARTGAPELPKLPAYNKEGTLGTARPSVAETNLAQNLPLTTKSANGMNTVSNIAGLKPWDQDWVFEGNPKPTAGVRPLFGPSDQETALAELKEAFAQLGAKNTQNPANPGATLNGSPISENPKARGKIDAGLEASLSADRSGDALKPGMTGMSADAAEKLRMAHVAAILDRALQAQVGKQGVQSNPLLQSRLAEMNGSMVMSGKPGGAPAASSADGKLGAAPSGQFAGLSGTEFMSTLSGVQGGQGSANAGGSDSQDVLSGGGGSRPGFQAIDANKPLGKPVGPGDSFLLSSPGALQPGAYQNPHAQSVHPAALPVTGYVVQGSMTKDQLSHEAILNMSTGIRTLSTQGGGEMSIRLKPENLGELHMRVSTDGNSVGLQIQASDEKAKHILQESLSSLKDSLASQNLTLAKVDLSVAHAAGAFDAHGESLSDRGHNQPFSQQQQQQQQQYGQSAFGQNAEGNRNQRFALWNDPDASAASVRPLRAGFPPGAGQANGNTLRTDGRLDVMA